MKVLLFIPARKNSKGIKDKNLKLIFNKHLIEFTLDFVKKVIKNNKKFTIDYFISSDSDKIINLCKKNGFKCDYKRPDKFALDSSSIIPTVLDGIKWLEKHKKKTYDILVLLQPTNPIRYSKEFNKILSYYKLNQLKSLISVTKVIQHPNDCIELINKKWNFIKKPKKIHSGRQQYSNNFFYIDGTYYISNVDFIKKNKLLIKEKITVPYKLSRDFSLNIDDQKDLTMAKFLLKDFKSN